MNRSKILQKKSHRLPPHSWETHHLANKGEANKTLVIAIVAVVVLVGLVLLLFVGKQFVGKAVSFGDVTQTNAAGFGLVSGAVKEGEMFILPVKVNLINRKSVAVGFSLKYDSANFEVKCSENDVFALLDKKFKGTDEKGQPYDLTFSRKLTCANGVINAEYSGMCKDAECSNAIQNKEAIAEIKFTPKNAGEYIFDFSNFVLIDMDEPGQPDFIVNALGTTVNVEPSEVVPPSDEGLFCGDNRVDGEEQCDSSVFVSGYSADCKQYGFKGGSASCTSDCEIDVNACEKFQKGESCMAITLPSGEIGSPCTAGLSCVNGICVKSECTDTDGKNNFNEQGTTGPDKFGNIKKDQCVIINGEIVEESSPPLKECNGPTCGVDDGYCEESTNKKNEFDGWYISGSNQLCPNGCKDGACVTELPVEEVPAPEIIIQLTPKSSNVPTVSVSKGITYNVKATITPNAALPANHLAIVTLNYGLEQKVIMVETKSSLAVGGTETLAFEHTINEAAGPLEVKVSVWNTWPSSGETWTNLVPPAEESYIIQ